MPLHVEVYINNTYLDGIHIGRTTNNSSDILPDSINTYTVVNSPLPPRSMDDWNNGIEFTHRYGDGALVCVRKAIEVLEESGNL